jgi:hypothetical protein
MHVIEALIVLALIAVVATLGMGFFALYRGGEYGRANSNKFMRWRIASQATAFVLILIYIVMRASKGAG